jgi:hypothetical protein
MIKVTDTLRSREIKFEILAALNILELCLSFFEQDGFKFFFYSNDHEPIHVHVRYAGGEAVFNINDTIELRESHGLKVKELSKAQSLAEANQQLIIEQWNEHLNQ